MEYMRLAACKAGTARCTEKGSCLSMSTASNCGTCGNKCAKPYTKCDPTHGCVGLKTVPAFQMCTGPIPQTICEPTKVEGYRGSSFSAGFAQIVAGHVTRSRNRDLTLDVIISVISSPGSMISNLQLIFGGRQLGQVVPITTLTEVVDSIRTVYTGFPSGSGPVHFRKLTFVTPPLSTTLYAHNELEVKLLIRQQNDKQLILTKQFLIK